MPKENKRIRRVTLVLTHHEDAVVMATKKIGGYADKLEVLRTGGVQGARRTLKELDPARLKQIDDLYLEPEAEPENEEAE